MMRTIGVMTSLVGIGVAVGVGILVVRSMPDIQRYVKMRQM